MSTNQDNQTIAPNSSYDQFGVYKFQEFVVLKDEAKILEGILKQFGLQFCITTGGYSFDETSITYHYRCDFGKQIDIRHAFRNACMTNFT